MTVDDAVDRATRRRHAPLEVAIGGHGRTGRATLAAAVRARFRLSVTVVDDVYSPNPADPPNPADMTSPADLTIRVIGAQPRRCDVDALAAGGPIVVVAGKADLRDDPAALAAAAARMLGVPVHPVSGLLAGAVVGPSDLELLRTDPVPDDVLGRFGLAGVAVARRLSAAGADEVTAELRRVSGVDVLAAAIRAVSAEVARARDVRMRADLRLAAARGTERDRAEDLLAGIGS